MTSGATPCPPEGVVSFNINTACNYRCSYCTQRFKEDRGRSHRDTPRFLAAFARLPGRWEIKLSGGEPFVHPTLCELTSGLAERGHRISVVTNFSASKERLIQFAESARGRVGIFSCSLHPEYVPDPAPFAEKAAWLQQELLARRNPELPAPHVCVTVVATRAILPELETLRDCFRAVGISFKVQPEKQNRDVVPYTKEEELRLLTLGGHNLTGEVAHDFHGLPCWAGSRYFILDDLGQAFRCYPARRYQLERLGDFLSPDFQLNPGPTPCQYHYCNCTVPIARRMMPARVGVGSQSDGE